jgi:SAM-dependent methyltransferase
MNEQKDKIFWKIWLSQFQLPALVCAQRLGFFEYINKSPGLKISVLAIKLNCSERGLRILSFYLESLGQVKISDNNCIQLSESSKQFLLEDHALYWGGMFLGWQQNPLIEELLLCVRSGRPTLNKDLSQSWKDEDAELENFYKAMNSQNAIAAQNTANYIKNLGKIDILDLGSGSGIFLKEIKKSNPEAKLTAFETPAVAKGLAEKFPDVKVVSGDFFEGQIPEGFDFILLNNILHDWNEDSCRKLLDKTLKALRPGGKLLLGEMVEAEHEVDRDLFWGFSLVMLLRTQGQQYKISELEKMCNQIRPCQMKVISKKSMISLIEVRPL